MPTTEPYDVLFVDQAENDKCALPTPDDIDEAEILVKRSTGGTRLVRVREDYVIKFGFHVKPIEAQNALFVAKSTTIPVPKVYAIYQRQDGKLFITFIVMQYIPGVTLQDLWGSLDTARKTAIAKTLHGYFDQLRGLRHPGYFGDIHGGPPLDDLFSATRAAYEIKTSIKTENELIDWIIRMYSFEVGERMAHKIRYYRHVLPTVLRDADSSPVFTHNDFQRKNVMVQPDGGLCIIDWEFSSWLPVYWEFTSATFSNGRWDDDWHDYVRVALQEYPNQALWLGNMMLEMWS
ncbi:kinase-like domain-containing protein [Hypoxylon argillaceum]|nr:kinase-like domain-containing protein [Hypoxylon argillaceum]KAI1147994.1 kinase-like domain-containing protein [Nemania diffusa]